MMQPVRKNKVNPRSHNALLRINFENACQNGALSVVMGGESICGGSRPMIYQRIPTAAEMAPNKYMTFLQPPSSGERTVALIIGPSISPKPMPMAPVPMALPRFFPLNHMPIVLVTLMGIINRTMPFRNTVSARVKKLSDNPRSAPVIPTNIQDILRKFLAPNLSLNTPAMILTKTPAKLEMPQIVPISTRLRSRSSDISLNRTGIQEKGIAETKVPDRKSV